MGKIDDCAKLDMLIFHMINDLLDLLQAPIITLDGIDRCLEFFDAWNENVPTILQGLFLKRLNDLGSDPASYVESNSNSGSGSGSRSGSNMESESGSAMEVDSDFLTAYSDSPDHLLGDPRNAGIESYSREPKLVVSLRNTVCDGHDDGLKSSFLVEQALRSRSIPRFENTLQLCHHWESGQPT